jgi:hypothetical protein
MMTNDLMIAFTTCTTNRLVGFMGATILISRGMKFSFTKQAGSRFSSLVNLIDAAPIKSAFQLLHSWMMLEASKQKKFLDWGSFDRRIRL